MVVAVGNAQIKQKIQQEQQLKYFLGLWPSAADKNTPCSAYSHVIDPPKRIGNVAS